MYVCDRLTLTQFIEEGGQAGGGMDDVLRRTVG